MTTVHGEVLVWGPETVDTAGGLDLLGIMRIEASRCAKEMGGTLTGAYTVNEETIYDPATGEAAGSVWAYRWAMTKEIP